MKIRSYLSLRSDYWYLHILWPLLLGAGLLIRIVVYLQNRSLFLDEANLARNIAELSYYDFFAPLQYQQYAPPFFLILEKLNYELAGASEFALRFWPLIMGCTTLAGLYLLIRKLVGTGWPSLLVFYLFAFSQVYIRYSSELKQYSTDMAVTTALIWAAIRYPPINVRRLTGWCILGGIAVWLSMPSVFLLAAVGLYFFYQKWWLDQEINAGTLLLPITFWLINFGCYYFLVLGNDLQRSELIDHHRAHFWPILPTSPEEWQQLWAIAKSLLSTLIGHTLPAVFLGIGGLMFGIFGLWKQGKGLLLLLTLPIGLCLIASGLGRYSLMERLSLFMMPAFGLWLAFGLNFAVKQAPGFLKWGVFSLGVMVLPLRKGMEYFVYPYRYDEMRALLTDLEPRLSKNDLIWVDHSARPAFIWYTRYSTRSFAIDEDYRRIIFGSWTQLAGEDIAELTTTTDSAWLLFSHLVSERSRSDLERHLRSMPTQYGARMDSLQQPAARAFHFVR